MQLTSQHQVKIWIRSPSLKEQIAWCFAMLATIALFLVSIVLLWRLGAIGGVIIGWSLRWLIRG
jgi:hypothetical protein